jgi:glycosyltransferase involved in cell wall biosynthesis
MPQYFPPGADTPFVNWLEVVAESDGAVCISKSVAAELATWVEHRQENPRRSFAIDWFHLGADVENTHPTRGLPPEAQSTLAQLEARPSFLMVGTMEPRKSHKQVLDAFEQLWHDGLDINLVIVGKQGWMVDELASRLRVHPELRNRLFWLEGISDDYLERIYTACTSLIAASRGEGFGLPLIEAANHKLHIIARDIPVFREVAGGHAYYFDAADAQGLAQAIEQWLALYRDGRQPRSDNISWLTWDESARQLRQAILTKGDLKC